MKKTINDMRQIAAQRGGHCLSTEYAGARKPLLWKCKSGHEWLAMPVNITMNCCQFRSTTKESFL